MNSELINRVAHQFLKITRYIFASDQSDEKLFHKVSRMVLLTCAANDSKLRKILTMNT